MTTTRRALPTPTQPPATHLLERDARGRISLARLTSAPAERYLAREEPGGVIILEPAVVMSAAQARLNTSPELLTQVTDAIAHPERATARRRRA